MITPTPMNINPFIYGRSVEPREFLGRKSEIGYLFNHLATCQSTAVVGHPHIGKTSLLKCIYDPATRQTYCGDLFERDIFSWLDAHRLLNVESQFDFWISALQPVEAMIRDGDAIKLSKQFRKAGNAKFNGYEMDLLLKGLKSSGRRVILLIDEFDSILSNPVLKDAGFFGQLRSLMSTSGNFAVIIASRLSIEELNNLTQADFNHGSPFFNTFAEYRLGPLDPDATRQLLSLAGERFTAHDQEYAIKVSGCHPYLAQVIAAMLWDAHEAGHTGTMRYQVAGRNLQMQSQSFFADVWKYWTNEHRKALATIALAQIPRLLPEHSFDVSGLTENFEDYLPELTLLEKSGIVSRNDANEWNITQDAFLWWLADELIRNVRNDAAFKTWLQGQEMDNLLSKEDKQQMKQAVQRILSVAKNGAVTLIESLAKGYGEGLGKSPFGDNP